MNIPKLIRVNLSNVVSVGVIMLAALTFALGILSAFSVNPLQAQTNDLPQVVITSSNTVIDEGETVTATITSDRVLNTDLIVEFSVDERSLHITGGDYNVEPALTSGGVGTVTISAGETTATIIFTAIEDGVYEPDEVFPINLLESSSYTLEEYSDSIEILTFSTFDVSIGVTEHPPSTQFDSRGYLSINEGETITLSVMSSRVPDSDLAVNFDVGHFLGLTSSDYISTPAVAPGRTETVVIRAGETTADIVFHAVSDDLNEYGEEFAIVLAAGDYEIGPNEFNYSTVHITINDIPLPPIPKISIDVVGSRNPDGRYPITEGETLAIMVRSDVVVETDLDVLLSVGPIAPATVDDYTISHSETVTIPAGERSATIIFTAIDDGISDDDETILIRLLRRVAYKSPAPDFRGITIFDPVTVQPPPGTVQPPSPPNTRDTNNSTTNDPEPDPVPEVTITPIDVVLNEGESIDFTVRSSERLRSDLIVEFETIDFLVGEATADDFILNPPNQVTIPAGELTATVNFIATNDDEADDFESVIIILLPGEGYVLNYSLEVDVSIRINDVPPSTAELDQDEILPIIPPINDELDPDEEEPPTVVEVVGTVAEITDVEETETAVEPEPTVPPIVIDPIVGGGILESQTLIEIPAGAYDDLLKIDIRHLAEPPQDVPELPSGVEFLDEADIVDIELSELESAELVTQLQSPVVVCLPLATEIAEQQRDAFIVTLHGEETEWERLGGTYYDPVTEKLCAYTSRFSLFAIGFEASSGVAGIGVPLFVWLILASLGGAVALGVGILATRNVLHKRRSV